MLRGMFAASAAAAAAAGGEDGRGGGNGGEGSAAEDARTSEGSAASASADPSTSTPAAAAPKLYPHLDLDFKPKLTAAEVVWCVSASAAAVLVYAVAVAKMNVGKFLAMHAKQRASTALTLTLVFAATFLVTRWAAREAQEQARLLIPGEAADPDSRFANVEGQAVHYKLRRPTGVTDIVRKIGVAVRPAKPAPGTTSADYVAPPMVVSCLHGFGANTYSWERAALQPLATSLGATVVAHDSPGFGLTERAADLSRYTPRHNARIARAMLGIAEKETAAEAEREREVDAARERAWGVMAGSQGGTASVRCRRVIVGHSMGGLAAAMAAGMGDVDDVVLVAPAVIARGKGRVASTRAVEGVKKATAAAAVFLAPFRVAAALASSAVRIAVAAAAYAFAPFLKLFLRKIVRSVDFWRAGLSQSVGRGSVDAMANDATWVDGYRRPSAVADWDTGMVRVVLAAATGGVNDVFAAAKRSIAEAATGRRRASETNEGPADANEVVASLAASGARVLIVHGENDAIVPVNNSRKLAAMLPGAKLVVMPGVGHMPHEEEPEGFLEEVRTFLNQHENEGTGAREAEMRAVEVDRARIVTKTSAAKGEGEARKEKDEEERRVDE